MYDWCSHRLLEVMLCSENFPLTTPTFNLEIIIIIIIITIVKCATHKRGPSPTYNAVEFKTQDFLETRDIRRTI